MSWHNPLSKKYQTRNAKKGKGRAENYGAIQSLCTLGHSHRSQLETAVCGIIQFRQRAGEIELLQVEDHILISGWFGYVADFKVRDCKTNAIFWIEAKGFGNDKWALTRKGWGYAGPGKLEVWGGDYHRPILVEVIIPRRNKEKIDE